MGNRRENEDAEDEPGEPSEPSNEESEVKHTSEASSGDASDEESASTESGQSEDSTDAGEEVGRANGDASSGDPVDSSSDDSEPNRESSDPAEADEDGDGLEVSDEDDAGDIHDRIADADESIGTDAQSSEDDQSEEWDVDDEASSAPSNENAGGELASHDAAVGAQPAAAGGGGVGRSGFGGGSTAPDDQEMPLTEHVEEMALRFMAVGLVVIGVGAITLFYADDLINFLWYSFLGPGMETCLDASLSVTEACPQSVSPRVYHPLALVLARLKVASLVGLIAALPVAVYQTYRFMRPGLYPRERRYYLAAVPTSLVLAAVGVGFAYFAILPAMFSYFTKYSEQAAEIAFGLTETFNLIVLMIGFFAIVFQIPLLVMLAIMMGVTTRTWLEDRRLYFWGGFAALAFLFSPDPTGMAPLMVAVTMIALFEGTLFLLRWTDSDSPLFSPAAFAERRPYAWGLAVLAGYLASAAPVPGSYYEVLPAVVRETLAYNELVDMTPIITAAALVLSFEVVAYLVRNYSREVRVWHAVNRSRFPYYMLALVVGYFASPNPPGLQVAQQVTLPTTEAVAITAGLIVGFELLIVVLRWRKKRMSVD